MSRIESIINKIATPITNDTRIYEYFIRVIRVNSYISVAISRVAKDDFMV